MFARLSVDTGLIRDYGAACAAQACDLEVAATRLGTLNAGSHAMFGPVGARFLAALARAADSAARTVAGLSGSMATATDAAVESAHSYESTDGAAGTRISGTC